MLRRNPGQATRLGKWFPFMVGMLAIVIAGIGSLHSATQDAKSTPSKAKTDLHKDPLPDGALARMGTLRWRHGEAVIYLAVTPDNKAVLTASRDNIIRLWDRETGKEIRRFQAGAAQGPQGGVGAAVMPGWGRINQGLSLVALSHDGKTLAALLPANVIQLWNVDTGKEIRQFKGPATGVAALLFSPDGKMLATRGGDRSIALLETETGKEIRQIKSKQQGNVRFFVVGQAIAGSGIAFSPDGKTIASAERDFNQNKINSYLKLSEVDTAKEIRQIETPNGVSAVAYAPNGKILAYGSGNLLHLCEADTAKEIRQINTPGGNSNVVFAPDSKIVATRGRDQVIHLWETDSGKALHQLGEALAPQGNNVAVLGVIGIERHDVAFSADGKLVISGEGQTVRQWDTVSGKELPLSGGHRGAVSALGLSPDGKTLVSRGADNTIRRWNAATGKELGQIQTPAGTMQAAFTLDGRTAALANTDGSLRLIDVATGKQLHQLKGHAAGRATLVFSPDGKTLASRGSFDNTIRLHNVANGGEIKQINIEPNMPANPGGGFVVNGFGGAGGQGLAFSPDGQTLAANVNAAPQRFIGGGQPPLAGAAGKLKMWDVTTGKEIRQITLPAQRIVNNIAYSPDGRLLAAENADQTISLWEIASGKERAVLGEPVAANQPGQPFAMVSAAIGPAQTPSGTLAFSPDGSLLAARAAGNIVRVWDVSAAKEVGQLKGHDGAVLTLAFAENGKTLASGSNDTTILVWDATRLHRLPKAASVALQVKEVETLWSDLIGGDAAKASQSIQALASAPKQSVPFLRERLQPATPPDVKKMDRWLAELDSSNFQTRSRALAELDKLGELALPALKKLHAAPPSVEVRRRVEPLLEKLAIGALSAEQIRVVRAVEVLEDMGSAEARQLLEALAKGAPGALPTRQAHAALERLNRQATCCEP